MSRIALRSLSLVLAIACVGLGVRAVLSIRGALRSSPATPPAAAAGEVSARGPGEVPADRRARAARDLFLPLGARAADGAARGRDREGGEEDGSLRLVGTVAAASAALARAAVEDRSTHERWVVKPGDLLKGARVVAVERARLVLDRGDQRTVLRIAASDGGARTAPAATPAETGEEPGPAALPEDPPEEPEAGEDAAGQEAAGEPPALRDPAALLAEARLQPKVEGGRIAGIGVEQVKRGSLVERIGLKDGDVVTEVNGRAIDGAAGHSAFYRDFATGTSLALSVRGPDGAVRRLQYRFEQEEPR